MNSASLTAGGPRSIFNPIFNCQNLDEDYVQGAFDLQTRCGFSYFVFLPIVVDCG